MPEITVSGPVGGREVALKAGKLALLADGAVTIKIGDTEVLSTATASRSIREGIDFFPLTIDVEERMYAVGRIPGSFFRREGRPTEKAILTDRLIDRPLRPSFEDGFRCETHIISTILSVDMEQPYDVVALNAASAALTISPIPFQGPIAGVRLALREGEWVPMPTFAELEESVFDLVVAGRRNDAGDVDIVMVEAGSTTDGLRLIADGQSPSDEATVARGLEEAKTYLGEMIDLQLQLKEKVGEPPEVEWPTAEEYSEELYARVEPLATQLLADVVTVADKTERSAARDAALTRVVADLGVEDDEEATAAVAKAFRAVMKKMVRDRIVKEGLRMDGRGPKDIRPLHAEVGVVARAHGSGLFQRGETQVLNVTTLGMLRMEQMLDSISIEETKRYMHHYNMPPFSTGETGFMRGPKRREIGHGALAEKALLPVIPSADEFPYAFRLVSEVLMSNGSTSMASVCGSSLSLMDAGVPIREPVAGIAMGLVAHDDGFVTLTDILGAEDALGDMDFKVAGTAGAVTALQMDTKVQGLPSDVLSGALEQAKEARLAILDVITKAIESPRAELSPYAPRIEAVQIPKDKIGEVIGPKGKMIRQIEEETGASLDIEEDGTIRIGATDGEALEAAKAKVLEVAFPPEAELNKEYEGEVVNITKFGAFVNILPGRDGLLHISKIGGSRRVERVEDELQLGDKIRVVVREIDDRGKVSLDLAGTPEEEPPRDRGERARGDGDRRGRRGGGEGRRRPDSDRRRDQARGRRSGPPRDQEQAGSERKVFSFEEEFEKGL